MRGLFKGEQMNLVLDAGVQLLQVVLLFVVITQNFGLRRRIRSIESQLGMRKSRE